MKITLYTIYSPTFKGFYNERCKCLDTELSVNTKLFSDRSAAMRKIEGIINEIYDMPYNRLCTELAWEYLSHKYNKSKWNLDVRFDELKATEDMFKDLEIKEVTLDVQA